MDLNLNSNKQSKILKSHPGENHNRVHSYHFDNADNPITIKSKNSAKF